MRTSSRTATDGHDAPRHLGYTTYILPNFKATNARSVDMVLSYHRMEIVKSDLDIAVPAIIKLIVLHQELFELRTVTQGRTIGIYIYTLRFPFTN